jgi:hypothetical protein
MKSKLRRAMFGNVNYLNFIVFADGHGLHIVFGLEFL